jgi:hypothetical protein
LVAAAVVEVVADLDYLAAGLHQAEVVGSVDLVVDFVVLDLHFLITCIGFLISLLITSWMSMLRHEVKILWFSLLRTSSWITSSPPLLLGSS